MATPQRIWTRRVLRAAINAYEAQVRQYGTPRLGLCWAFDAGMSSCYVRWPVNYRAIQESTRLLNAHAARYRRGTAFAPYTAFTSYWWSFDKSGVRARRRVLRALCAEYGIPYPKV